MTKKGIVFCHTCNRIVGTEFPVWDHGHSFEMRNEILTNPENIGLLGYGYYVDTPKMRKHLEKEFPPRDEIVIKL
jgi:hypothetical protein